MKRRDVATWVFNEDVGAGLTEIETETMHGWSQQDINDSIAELCKMVLVLSATMAVFVPIVALLWP